MFRRFALLVVFLIACTPSLLSQAVYLPVQHEIYGFLKRMEAKGLIESYLDAARPLARIDLARYLNDLERLTPEMTRLERETFEFLKTDFRYEMLKLLGDTEPSEDRWHIWSTEVKGGVMNLDIDFRYAYSFKDSNKLSLRTQGLKLYGYTYDDVGYYFNLVDTREAGQGIDRLKRYTSEQGIVPSRQFAEVLEYDAIDAQLTYRTGGFTFSLEKASNFWGYGRRGQVIMSGKSPSYPQWV